MEEREAQDIETCVLCGEDVDPAESGSYTVTPSSVICFRCARTNGGVWDAETETWKVRPRVPSLGSRLPREDA